MDPKTVLRARSELVAEEVAVEGRYSVSSVVVAVEAVVVD